MNKTAGHMMGPMGLMDDDAKMLCKVLEISAAQALALKKKIKMGHKLPSWAEYKIYKAGDALKSAMASTHSMRDHMPKITIAIKSGPSMGSVLPSNMSKSASITKEAKLPKEIRALFTKKELKAVLHGKGHHGWNYLKLNRHARAKVMRDLGPKAERRFSAALEGHRAGRALGDARILSHNNRLTLSMKTSRKKIRAADKKYGIIGSKSRYKKVWELLDDGKSLARSGRRLKSAKTKRVSLKERLHRPLLEKKAMMGNSPLAQKMNQGSGLPGYSKGGPVKKDGYLTDKKGKPYARVHKGEKVVPKDEKTKKAWAKIARGPDRTPMLPPGPVGENLGRTRALAKTIRIPKAVVKVKNPTLPKGQ